MGRPQRAAEGGLIYHVWNRANARMTIFEKEGDYEAFERVIVDAQERSDRCLLPHAKPLAFCPLAYQRRWFVQLHRLDDADAHATVARSPTHERLGTLVPGPFQIVSRPGRRAFLHGLPLRRAQCVTSESGGAGGRLAQGKLIPMEGRYAQGEKLVIVMAALPTAKLDRAREQAAD